MYGHIYIVTNIDSGMCYVGKRKGDPSASTNYLGSGIRIRAAVKKYGHDRFIKAVLQKCDTLQELNAAEREWIAKFDAINSDSFYNLAPGGDGGDLGPVARVKISEKAKGNKRWVGKSHTDDSKSKISLSQKARWDGLSDAERDAYSQARSELYRGEGNPMFGKIHPNRGKTIHTEEFKAQLSSRLKGNQNGKLCAKKYTVIDPNGMKYDVDNMNDFCREHELNATKMREVARGGRSHHRQWKAIFR